MKDADAKFQAYQEGQSCDEISQDYRQCPQGSHVIFYRLNASGGVEIIRILHKRMLPEGHLLLRGYESATASKKVQS